MSAAHRLVRDFVPNPYVMVAMTEVLRVVDLEADEGQVSNAFVRAIRLHKADVRPLAAGVHSVPWDCLAECYGLEKKGHKRTLLLTHDLMLTSAERALFAVEVKTKTITAIN